MSATKLSTSERMSVERREPGLPADEWRDRRGWSDSDFPLDRHAQHDTVARCADCDTDQHDHNDAGPNCYGYPERRAEQYAAVTHDHADEDAGSTHRNPHRDSTPDGFAQQWPQRNIDA